MRAISAALLAAQKSASSEPYVDVIAQNIIGGVTRLDYTQLDATANPIAKHDVCVAGDGSVTRVRIDAGAVKAARTTTPGTGSSWNTWASLAAGMGTVIACAANGTRVIVVYADATDVNIKYRESTDSGATFGAETAVGAAAAAVVDLSVAYKNTAGDLCIVFATAAGLYASRRTAGAFAAASVSPLTPASFNGVAVTYAFDYEIVVTGAEQTTNKPTLWTTAYGDGGDVAVNTWMTATVQQQAESDAQVTYQAPFLTYIDTYRMTFVEVDAFTGGATRAYRSYLVFSLAWTAGAYTWRTPAPVNYAGAQGLAIAGDATNGYAYETAPDLAQRAPKSAVSLTLTPNVMAAEIFESDADIRGHIDLDNTAGQYAGPPSPIQLGNQVKVSWGYRTPAVATSQMAELAVAGYEYRRTGGVSILRLYVEGGWAALRRNRQRTSIYHAAGATSYLTILTRMFARAGTLLSNGGASARSGSVTPAFQIHTTTAGYEAMRQALDALADRIIFRAGSFASIFEPLSSEATDYTFGGDHPIRHARLLTQPAPASEAHAFGAGAFGESIDYALAAAYLGTRHQRRDANSTTGAQAAATAAAHLRQTQLDTDGGELTVPPSCGLEPLDVVDVSDPLVNAAAIKRRVQSITWRYDVRRTVYEQEIRLGAV